ANKAEPAAVPPPPAASAPPPNHANAALVAAAPLNVEIAVPVEAVPNVVAIAIAADGPNAATPTPAATPPLAPPAVFFSDASISSLISYTNFSNFLNSIFNFSTSILISSGLLRILFKNCQTFFTLSFKTNLSLYNFSDWVTI